MKQVYGVAPSFSIMDVISGMGRRKLLILSCLFLGAAIGLGMVTLVKPKFQAEARVLIDNLSTPYDTASVQQQSTTAETPIDERTVGSQVAVIESEDLGKRVVTALALNEKPEFDPMKSGLGLVGQILIAAGFADDPRLMTVEQRAYNHYSGALTVYPIPASNVIGIKYTAREAEIAANVANSVAETYVLSTRENRTGDTERATQWLASQIQGLRQKVSQADAAVERYRAEAGLLKGQTATLGTQELSELNTQITSAEAASSEAKAKADEIRNMLETRGNVEGSSDVIASPIIQRLQEQQVSAERRYTELSATYLSNHPKMLAVRKEVANIDARIRREALKVVDGLQGQAKIAAARAASLRKSLDGMKTREGGAAQDEVKLKELEREAKATRDQLELMLGRFADSNTRQNLALQPGFARVIQTASVPAAPFFPKIGPIVLLATLAGLGLGVGLAFLFEIMSQATRMTEALVAGETAPVRSRHPARGAMDHDVNIPQLNVAEVATPATVQRPQANTPPAAPVTLASIPAARSGMETRALLSALSKDGSLHHITKQLRQHLDSMRAKSMLTACGLAGVGSHNVGAALSLALAREFSDNGVKTLLIDVEAHSSPLPDLLELPHAPGISELLSGASDFTKAIQRDTSSALQFLRYGSLAMAADARLGTRMEAIVQTLTGIYDMVIVHAGQASPATLYLAKGCNTILIQAPEHRQRDAVAASQTLTQHGFSNVYLIDVEPAKLAAA
jgi:polysaccharide biosynthesis transport protein